MATYPFDQLPKVMNKHSKAIEKSVTVSVKAIADVGISVIADNTPVDTTKAVSNWKTTLGAPDVSDAPPLVAGSVKGSGARQARSMVKSKARTTINKYTGKGSIFIANAVPYIRILEYGGPKNRPSGMVAKGLQAMRVRARNIKILSDKV